MEIFDRITPHGVIREWLGRPFIDQLLSYSLANESFFKEAHVGHHESEAKVNHRVRRSRVLFDLGGLEDELETKLRDTLPFIFEKIGTTPFVPRKLELELVAHGDGAFYARHVDITKFADARSHRAISAVYYLHSLPKAFSGGALRLYSLGATDRQTTFVDIEPNYDTLVFFPSWFPHEVLPVKCPDNQFSNSRFAINFWIHREIGAVITKNG